MCMLTSKQDNMMEMVKLIQSLQDKIKDLENNNNNNNGNCNSNRNGNRNSNDNNGHRRTNFSSITGFMEHVDTPARSATNKRGNKVIRK